MSQAVFTFVGLPDQPDAELAPKTTHVLLVDIVGYSRLLVNEQIEAVRTLNQVVRSTPAFRAAEEAGKLTRLPTGDGMALLFFESPEAPARCALEIASALRVHPEIQVRMGAHTGAVSAVSDVNDQANVAGAGINIAQRVMDCGDAGHILLSKALAENLAQYRHWQPYLHDLGKAEVKHGLQLDVVNLHKDQLGNPEVPSAFRRIAAEARGSAARSSLQRRRRRVIRDTSVALAVVVLSMSLAAFFWRKDDPLQMSPAEKTIGVLPLSADAGDNQSARLARSLHDVLLTTLATRGDLTVITRGSVTDPRLEQMTPHEKANALGAATLVEGSLQREGSRFRVHIQLVDGRKGKVGAARDFTGDETELLHLQTRVADFARAAVGSEGPASGGGVPTENLAAYEFYFEGKEWERRGESVGFENQKKAATCFEQAVALDPHFTIAETRLAYSYLRLFWLDDEAPERDAYIAKAEKAIEHAAKLAPDSPYLHAAIGFHHYYAHRLYEEALAEFRIAESELPNDPDIARAMALIQRRRGVWDDCLDHMRRAAQLDPLNASILIDLSETYEGLRRYDEASQVLERAGMLVPLTENLAVHKGLLHFHTTGDTSVLREILRSIDPASEKSYPAYARFRLNILERRFDDAIADLLRSRTSVIGEESGRWPKELLLALCYRWKGEEEQARVYFDQARVILEQLLQSGSGPFSRITLAVAYAGLGRRSEALQQGTIGKDARSIAKDAVAGPPIAATFALAETILGDVDPALTDLQQLATVPFGLSKNELRFDPGWDPLRSDRRFQALVAP
ncbi:MAG: hypothetical protein M3032_08740 [Verrucomicrobiota bacterium]|nr:hypothetical protein [Verrucomicrobiota bacterium]